MATPQQKEQLIALTIMMFNASPGASYLEDFEAQIDSGQSLGEIAAGLASTEAFNSRFEGMVTEKEKIDLVLSGVGINEGSPDYLDAYQFFSDNLAAGRSPAELLVEASEFLSTTNDDKFEVVAKSFTHKVEVGAHHSIALGVKETSIEELQSAISGITDDPATVVLAKDSLNKKQPEPVPEPKIINLSGILESDLTISNGDVLNLNGDVQISNNAVLTIADGGTLNANSYLIENFGQMFFKGDKNHATINDMNVDMKDGSLLSSFKAVIESSYVSDFMGNTYVTLNESVVKQSTFDIDKMDFVGSLLIDSLLFTNQTEISSFVDNTFVGDSYIKSTSWIGGETVIKGNNFFSEGLALELDSFFDLAHNIENSNNYWGTNSEQVILDMIIDGRDDLNINGTVDIASRSDSPTPAPLELLGFSADDYIA